MGTTFDSIANSGTCKGRPNYSPDFKRRIVAAASLPVFPLYPSDVPLGVPFAQHKLGLTALLTAAPI
jgi:hypothetical protein